MKLSTDRILTTHVGSLPRPEGLLEILDAQDEGWEFDHAALDAAAAAAVEDVVHRQIEAGIDIVSDGEMSKMGYTFYVRHRLSGIGTTDQAPAGTPPRFTPRDVSEFADIAAARKTGRLGAARVTPIYCIGPIVYDDRGPVDSDIRNIQAALDSATPAETFVNAASPGVLAMFVPNTHYASEDAYVADLADAMKTEYQAIHDAGFVLQLDCPELAMGRHSAYQELSESEFLKTAERNVEAINHATAGIPPEDMRIHICWGNYAGPHIHDIPVSRVIDLLLRSRPAGVLFEAANPRHEHEWEDWASARIPDDKILIPGVIDSTSNFVEHPRLIAQRISRYADIVGRERVIAGTDCGFGTFAGSTYVFPSIVWVKLRALADGAALASEALWSRA